MPDSGLDWTGLDWTYDVKRRVANDDVVTDMKSERDYVVTDLLV